MNRTNRMGWTRMAAAVLLLAICLPAWKAGAQELTTEQKYEALKDKGIFTGFSDGSSRLGDPMTREQFAAVLFRLWGLTEEKPAKATFGDVLKTRWSYSNIEAVNKAGLMQGIGHGRFSPLTPVTVEQLAAVFVRAYGYQGAGASVIAGRASPWARASISVALDHGFIPAQSDYTVKATRGLLVEAAYAADREMNAAKLSVSTVQPLANSRILVTLKQAVTSVDLSHFSLKNEQGGAVSILRADLSTDGKSITLYTGPQNAYIIHTLSIDGDAWRYTAVSDAPVYVPPVDPGPSIAAFANAENGQLRITFSEPVTLASATNSANYQITRGDLSLRTFALSDDRMTVTIGTSEQSVGYSYLMTVKGVTDLAGNVMATRTDLSFTGVADRVKPTIVSVTSQGNRAVKVVFSEPVNASQARDEDNYKLDNGARIGRATLSGDGTTVTLSTSKLEDGKTYTLTVRDIADRSWNEMDEKSVAFVGGTDRTKPMATAVSVLGNSTVRVQFSEKVNASQAADRSHYSIDNGLAVLGVLLEDGGDSVVLTTSKQTDAVLYNLTVQGISDLAGNVMDKQTGLYFGGLVDHTAPTVSSITAANNQVILTFSERLDSYSATYASNYRFDGGLYAASVKYDDAKRTVTIGTSAQTPGKVYTLTINQVEDLSGLPVDTDTRLQFVGSSSGVSAPVALQSLAAVDRNTVQATFNRALYDSDVAALALKVLTDNGTAVSMKDWDGYVSRKPGTDNAVTVQFRTEKDGNPSLFKAGHVYVGEASGIEGLATADGANRKPFAGTDKANADPYVTQAAALNDRAVKVTFSEPVRNVSAAGFRILRSDDSSVKIGSVSAGGLDSVVTEAILYLDDELSSGRTYRLQFRGSVTDAAGWNPVRTTEDSKPYEVVFAGTSTENAAPRISRIDSPDRYTFAIGFSEPVRVEDVRGFSLYNETDRVSLPIDDNTYAEYMLSEDRQTLTVYLDASKGQQLQAGKRYRLGFDSRYGVIADDQGATLNGTLDPIEFPFYSTGADNARPSIASVEARGTQLRITFSEPILGYDDQTSLFDIEIAGKDVKPTAGSIEGKTVTLKVPAMTSGSIGHLSINDRGVDEISDFNRLKPLTDEVAFGVQ